MLKENLNKNKCAIHYYKKAISASNEEMKLYLLTLSLLYSKLKEKDKAKIYLEKSLKITKIPTCCEEKEDYNNFLIDKIEKTQAAIFELEKKEETCRCSIYELEMKRQSIAVLDFKIKKINQDHFFEKPNFQEEKHKIIHDENMFDLKKTEIDEFLLEKEKNKEIEEYKKNLIILFNIFFNRLNTFRINPKVDIETNFIFSFIASKSPVGKILFHIYTTIVQKNKIQEQIKILKKIDSIFSIDPVSDFRKLICMILKDKKIREEIINSRKNEEVITLKKQNYLLRQAKKYFDAQWINFFETDSEFLALRDFEIIKEYLLSEIFPQNFDYTDSMELLYKNLKENKYIKNNRVIKFNKSFDIDFIKIYKSYVCLEKQYSLTSKHSMNVIIRVNNDILYDGNFHKVDKKFKINLENIKNKGFLKKGMLEVELKIYANFVYHNLTGILDLDTYPGEYCVDVDMKIKKYNEVKGCVRIFFHTLKNKII